MPVVPSATQEAEAGGSLKPGSLRLQCAVIVPLHSNLDNRARSCLKKKKNKNKISLNANQPDFELHSDLMFTEPK